MEKPKEGFTIYTKSNCHYCDKIKDLIPNGYYINCDEYLDDPDEFLDFLDTITNERPTKFPMVFKDKKYIGGYSKVAETQINFNTEF